jgi:hypothetical protein
VCPSFEDLWSLQLGTTAGRGGRSLEKQGSGSTSLVFVQSRPGVGPPGAWLDISMLSAMLSARLSTSLFPKPAQFNVNLEFDFFPLNLTFHVVLYIIATIMAANQSRRRSEVVAERPSPILAKPCLDFSYEPLDKNVDCARLLSIQPAENDQDPIHCGLFPVEFGHKPQYEALSYAWGSPGAKTYILVNNCRFLVGQNLCDALYYLRGQARAMPIWVDAICINQDDIPERNRQLRIMHHIYSRAITVVVWLGGSYSAYHQTVAELLARQTHGTSTTTTYEPLSDLDTQEDISTAGKDDKVESDMVKKLYNDEYWKRVWIIQEIGLAEQVEVCFGSSAPMHWSSFIHLITMHNLGSEGPMRLSKLRHGRNTGSHTLRTLLRDHQEAKCKERRDKVYGLIGLAADAHRFPMDYTKSLIEVWADVMHYTKKNGLLPEEDTVMFGALVKYLLMDKECTPLEQVLRSYQPGNNMVPPKIARQEPESFWVTGFVIGQVTHVGPSTTDIISKLDSVDDWNEKVQENFHREVDTAHLESRTLIRAVLSQSQIKTCYNHVSSVRWQLSNNDRIHSTVNYHMALSSYLPLAAPQEQEDDERFSKQVTSRTDPRLLQLQSNIRFGASLWRMGFSPYQTKRGDLLVWIAHIKHAVVVRPRKIGDISLRLQIVGTAWVTEDIVDPDIDHMARLGAFHDSNKIPVVMDAETIFILLA